jgi:hypothetical protein
MTVPSPRDESKLRLQPRVELVLYVFFLDVASNDLSSIIVSPSFAYWLLRG